jgi:hypothetical protein
MKINWTQIIITLLVIALVLFLWDWKCNGSAIFKPQKAVRDTISVERVVTNTIHTKDTTYIPKIIRKTDSILVTFWEDTLLPPPITDSFKVYKEHYTINEYRDSQSVNNGYVIIEDRVTQNQIMSRRLTANIPVQTVTNTITLKPKPTAYPYVSANLTGGYVWSAGLGIGLKDKKDRIWKVNYNSTISGQTFITGEAMLPVRFKKK